VVKVVGMPWQIQGLKNEYLQGLKGDCDIIFGVVLGMGVIFWGLNKF